MKYNSKKVLTIIAILCLIIAIAGNSFAHSGRTDSSGGHKDNKNKSGLGSYHYHCGGYPAHLHDNGACPYSSNSYSSSSSTSYSSESTNNTNSTASTESSSSESVTTSASVEDIPTPISTPEPIIEAEKVEINVRISSMKVGEINELTATITPENTEDKNITWKSNDEDIATVSSTGKVVALETGTVNITATTTNGKTDTIEIIVEEVKEENNINAIVAPIQNNELKNTSTNTTEGSDTISGLIGLGLIGGGGYWVYRKFRK